MDDETGLEKLTGNLLTETALTAIAVSSGAIHAALLPLLANTLASNRYKKRVENTLNDYNKILMQHEAALKNINDNQFKLINEIVLTNLQTVNEKKIEYLKTAVKNIISGQLDKSTHTTQLSRVIRDISAKEISFLINNRDYKYITFDPETTEEEDLGVDPITEDGTVATGLISLGLIIPGPDVWDGQKYIYSPLVRELIIAVLR